MSTVATISPDAVPNGIGVQVRPTYPAILPDGFSRFTGPLRVLRARDTGPATPIAQPPDPSKTDDAEDHVWVTAIVRAHGTAILAYATRLTGDRHAAEDVVQETLIRAWRNREELHEDRGSVRSWLLTVTRNIAIDRARARTARPPEVAQTPTAGPLIGDHADELATTITVLEALDQLSEEHRTVLTELYLNDRSVVEVAEKLNLPTGTVKSRSHYALRRLRDVLKPADLQ